MRNVFKQAEKGAKIISPQRDLSSSEIKVFLNSYSNSTNKLEELINIISTAYYMGVYQGIEQTKRS